MLNRRTMLAAGVSVGAGLLSPAAAVAAKPAEAASVAAGEMSAVILGYKKFQYQWCDISITNIETRKEYTFSMSDGFNIVGGRTVNLIVVPPGAYRIADGHLYGGSAYANMPLLRLWFKDFSVAPGEVIDLGTINLAPIDVKSFADRHGLSKFLSFGDPSQGTTYITYSIDDSNAAAVQKLLTDKYPSLLEKLQARPLQPFFDKEKFGTIIVESYAANQDGTPPSTEVARARVRERLTALILEQAQPQQ